MKARSALAQGFIALLLVALMIIYSDHGFRASQEGMKLFLDVVLPSLLPFFILSEVLLAFGVVHFLGELFEPLMRPLFNVPGAGSFVLSMGLAAGYPMDAVITAKFRRQGMCTRVEGERMLAFSNTADPLFIFGAVAVGMFGMPALGAALAAAHYIGAFLVGLVFRSWGRNEPEESRPPVIRTDGAVWHRAARALVQARNEDGRPLGVVLQEAIRDSIATLFMIMSFIVLFSVLIRVLDATGVMVVVLWPVEKFLALLGLAPGFAHSVVQGILEIDIGSAAVAKVPAALIQRAAVASAIIAWSGLSVQGQVASVLSGTDIRMRPYILARLLHAGLAAVLTVLLLPLFHLHVPALLATAALPATPGGFVGALERGTLMAAAAGGLPLALGLAYGALRRLRVLRLRV